MIWAITENLGDWTVVRKRLNDEFQRKQGTPLASTGFIEQRAAPDAGSEYFEKLGQALRDATDVGWSSESPATILTIGGRHSWPIGTTPDSVPLARHTALTDDGREAATAPVLASRAEGRPVWGVLRGDVDSFGIRMRRLQSIEEYVQLSVLYKQFFAGEVEVLCSLPEFWRKVNLLHTGGDDFAVYGAWDALIGFARELQRLFQRFTEEHLKEFPGPEGKTITMALALAPELDTPLGSVYGRSRDRLEIAKSADKDCFYSAGPNARMEAALRRRRAQGRAHGDGARIRRRSAISSRSVRHLSRNPARARRQTRGAALAIPSAGCCGSSGSSRSRDFQKARASLIADLVGKNPANLKLRPSGRVALEWARLSTEGPAES